MRPRPRHGLPLIDEQKRALVALLEGNSAVLFNKSQQPQHLKNKTEAWEQITRRFNELFPAKDGFTPRTTYCLKRWWDNYKQKVKREQAERKLHWQETGEDAPLPETGDPLYVAASPLLRAELSLGDSSMDSMPCPQSSSPRQAVAAAPSPQLASAAAACLSSVHGSPPAQLTVAAAACLSSILGTPPPPRLTAAAAACLSSVQGAPPPQLTAAAAACPSLQGAPPPQAAAVCLSSVRGAPPPQLTTAEACPSSLQGAPPPSSPPPITAAAAVPACLPSVKGTPPPPSLPSLPSQKSEQTSQADCCRQISGEQSPQHAVEVIVKEEPSLATPSPPPSPIPTTSSVPQKSEQITQADCYRQIRGQQSSLHELRLKYLREEHEYRMEVLKAEKEYLELKKKNELEMGQQRERFEIERHKQKMQHDRKLFILQKKVLLAQLRKNK